MNKEKVEARRLMKKYNTNDPFKLCDQMNIYLKFDDLGSIRGYYIKERRIKVICLNKYLNEMDKKIVCMHEIGHFILHKGVSTPFFNKNTLFSTNKLEIEANRFAVEMFVPDELYDNFRKIYGYTIEQISKVTNLPIELVKLKG